MHKKIIPLFCLFLIILSGCGSKEVWPDENSTPAQYLLIRETDYSDNRLTSINKSKVASVIEYTYDENGRKTGYTYTDNITSIFSDEEPRTLTYTWTYQYNEQNLAVSATQTGHSYNGELIKGHEEYTYDENGNMITKLRYYSFDNAIEKLVPFGGKTTYEYDENNNLIRQRVYSTESSGDLYEYKYDAAGNKKSGTLSVFSSSGTSALVYFKYNYNAETNKFTTSRYSANKRHGVPLAQEVITFDDYGRKVLCEYYTEDGLFDWTEYEYTTLERLNKK